MAVQDIGPEEMEAFISDPAIRYLMEFDTPPKKKRSRGRLLQGMHRTFSTTSLRGPSRGRSSSSPYHGPGSFSCVSLTASPSPFGQPSAGYFSMASPGAPCTPNSSPGTPGYEYLDDTEGMLAARRITNLNMTAASALTVAFPLRSKKAIFNVWEHLPRELKIHVLSYMQSTELIVISGTSKEFQQLCYDGQLWQSFDASEFYTKIPAESLARIIVAAGPFIKDLNLRGCVQVEHYRRAEVIVKACQNLINATLEGCRNLQRTTLHGLVRNNSELAHLNLTGLTAVTNATCKLIAQSCPSLELLNVSWCKHVDATGIKAVIEGCPKLKDLRAREIQGFDSPEVARIMFKTNRLERLFLSGCKDLSDETLKIMVHGAHPPIDILTDLPNVPPRKLRHLDLARCSSLTSTGVKALGHLVPNLEGLSLAHCAALTDSALAPILSTTPRLTHLDLEDCRALTNHVLSEHLAKAPCAPHLDYLCISSCENLGDSGMLPVIRRCESLRTALLDNTRISDLVLTEAAAMIRRRSTRTADRARTPQIGLSMTVYDCQHVSWKAVRDVLSNNAEIRTPCHHSSKPQVNFPTEIIALKCFYGWNMTVDEHTKRVLRGDLLAAKKLELKWTDYMQANEEAGTMGAGGRRRRRRARQAQAAHADEEGGDTGGGRRRARTMACAVM